MELEDRFYTSTEVAEILGVSLRSVYRYLEEGKLVADVKTATGRHRFTKQNILDFLYPQGAPAESKEKEKDSTKSQKEEVKPEKAKEEEKKEEDVDWLSKFKEAAEKHRTRVTDDKTGEKPEEVQQEVQPAEKPSEEPKEEPKAPEVKEKETLSSLAAEEPVEEKKEEKPAVSANKFYYTSNVGGLKELAQYINKTARKSNIPYAFTMSAGISLHKLIRPFSVLHIYIRTEDKEFFEKALELTSAEESTSQLCMYIGSQKVMDERKEVHGLYVVSDNQLKQDLVDAGETDLASELEEALNS